MKDSDLKKLKGREEFNAGRGLRARKNSDGTVTFQLFKKMKGRGSPLRRVLGTYPDMSIDKAEAKAVTYRNLIESGIDPKDYEEEQRDKDRLSKKDKKAKAITLSKLLDEYEMSRISIGKGDAPNTLRDHRNCIQRVWEPWLDTPIQKIEGNDLVDQYYWYTSQRKGRQGKPAKSEAKKGIRVLKTLFNYAINVKEYVDVNPCRKFQGMTPTTSNQNEYFLQPRETHNLWDWLERLSPDMFSHLKQEFGDEIKEYDLGPERQIQYHAIALQLLTGLRKKEVLQLPWEDVYLEKQKYEFHGATGPYFRVTTSKQKKPFAVPITEEMEWVFKGLERSRVNDFVFPSPRPAGKEHAPLGDDKYAYEVLNKLMPNLIEAPKMSANVMRHTFATCSYNLFKSFEITDMITGHISGRKNTKVATSVYVHILADAHREFFEKINTELVGRPEDKRDVVWEAMPEPEQEDDDPFEVVEGGYVAPEFRTQ